MRSGVECRIELDPGGGLDGVVVETGTRRLVGGAHVEAIDQSERPERKIAESDSAADGTFRLDGVPAGKQVAVRVTEPHHAEGRAECDPASGMRVEIALDPAGAVRGVVTDPTGAPAPWATVKATPQVRRRAGRRYSHTTLSATTDPDGRYVLGGLEFGATWTVTASKPGLADAVPRAGIEFDAAKRDLVCDFALRAAAHLDVRVFRADGKPASGASVCVDTQSGEGTWAPLGEAGAKLVDVYEPGRCVVRVESASSPPKTVEVEVEPGATRVVDVTLDAGVAVSGVVVDDLGSPKPGVGVVLSAGYGSRSRATTSAADGTFRFEGLAAGEHEVSAQEPDGRAWRRVEVVAPSEGARLVLPRRGSISLRVRAPGGVPLTECTVTVVDPISRFQNGFGLSSARGKDPGDEFRAAASAGTCTVTVQAPGFVTLSRDVEVAPGADTSLGELVLDPGLSIEGSVVDAQGHAIDGAVVGLGPPDIAVAQTDGTGRFTMTNRAAGEVSVFARAEGFTYARVKYRLAPGCAPLVITLRRGGVLRGTVRDADGHPVHDAGLSIVPRDRPSNEPDEPDVDEDGKFTVRLDPGPWRVTVTRDEETVATKDVDVREGEETSVEIVVPK
jgi:protocatechuate 3,4-dioxygenase beta subunit